MLMNYEHLNRRPNQEMPLMIGELLIVANYRNCFVESYQQERWNYMAYVGLTREGTSIVDRRLFDDGNLMVRLGELNFPFRLSQWPNDDVIEDWERQHRLPAR